MHEIIAKTYELIDTLDNSNLVSELTSSKKSIMDNNTILDLIDRGRKTSDDREKIAIKKELYNNEDYKRYTDSYNQLFYLVMDYNSKLNKLVSCKECFK